MPGQLVVEPASLCFGDLVVGVGPADLIRPLHLVGLDDQRTDLRLAVHSRRERDNKVGAVFAIRLQQTLPRRAGKLSGRAFGEERSVLALLLDVVGQADLLTPAFGPPGRTTFHQIQVEIYRNTYGLRARGMEKTGFFGMVIGAAFRKLYSRSGREEYNRRVPW